MPAPRQWTVTRRLPLCNGRKGQQNRRPAAQLALGGHTPALCFDEMFHDGEPQAGPPLLARTAGIDSVESLKNASQVLGGDSASRVADSHENVSTRRRSEDAHPATGRRVTQRVVEQIGEDLTQG